MDKEEYLIRRSIPNKYDHAAKDTIIKVVAKINNKFKVDYYVQRSSDEENPIWELTDLS